MTTRKAVSAALAATLVGVVFVLGVALRPALVDDPRPVAPLSSVEVGYLQDMIAHHQQAVSMARLIDRAPLATPVRGLARQIVQAQSGEIGTMVGILQMADQPITSDSPMSWMHRYGEAGDSMHDHGAHAPMPGMATTDEVASLGLLTGVAAENEFLRLMQRHHYGGIAMSQDLLSYRTSSQPVVRLARSSLTTQTSETGVIGAMLHSRGIGQK